MNTLMGAIRRKKSAPFQAIGPDRSKLLGILLLSAIPVVAQETRGTICGRTLGPSSAVIPGAKLIMLNTEANVPTPLTGNTTGYFEAGLLLTGTYRISAETPGLNTSVRDGLILQVGSRLLVDMQLEVGANSKLISTCFGKVTSAGPGRLAQIGPKPHF